jgi:hypothetical protein
MFSSDPGFERPFQWQLTYSRMRLTGVSPDQVLPLAAPVTVRLEDLPIGPSLRELGLVESHSETRTNAPGLLDFTWQPTIPGWQVVSAYAEDMLGRLWLTPQIHLFFTPINDDFANATTLSGARSSQLVYLAGVRSGYLHEDMPIFRSNPALTRRKC